MQMTETWRCRTLDPKDPYVFKTHLQGVKRSSYLTDEYLPIPVVYLWGLEIGSDTICNGGLEIGSDTICNGSLPIE